MSSRPPPSRFRSSEAKDQVRYSIDRDLIEGFKNAHYPDRPLRYLGLPGERLLDILSWRRLLGECVAVESTPLADALEIEVMRRRLEGMVRVLRCDIDALLSDDRSDSMITWPFQVVNLDYCGGLVHLREDRTSQRLDALEGLFRRQGRWSFVLFLTVNLRDADRGEFDGFLAELESDLAGLGLEGVTENLMEHRQLGRAGELKAYVPNFLLRIARWHTLRILAPLLYRGTKPMMHFAAECVAYSGLGAGRMPSTQDRISLLNLPLLRLPARGTLREIQFTPIR